MSQTLTEKPAAAANAPQPATGERKPLTKKEIAADHPTWCPGCGDFAVLALYYKLVEKRQLWHERVTTVSGIGCSSRFPYFVQAHGAHFIHGRDHVLGDQFQRFHALGQRLLRPDKPLLFLFLAERNVPRLLLRRANTRIDLLEH